jgi:lambda family phage portal protein
MKLNFIDKFLIELAPETGAKRIAARMIIDSARSFDAGSRGDRTSTWNSNLGSANAETLASLTLIRARARDFERNNPYSKRAIEVISNNTVGTGIRPSHKGLTEAQTKKIKMLWSAWAETTAIDFFGQKDIYGIQDLVMKTVARDGECLVIRRVNKTSKTIPFQLQVLEIDYLDDNIYSPASVTKGHTILQGVEFDASGKKVAYWLYDNHPGDPNLRTFNTVPKRVLAEYVCHIYDESRPGQVRGIPFGVSAMVRLKDFEEYQDAELIRRKVASLMVAFVTDAQGSALGTSGKGNKFPKKMTPGSILETNPGQTVTLSSPPSVDGYAEYTRVELQSIAIAYGVTYEALTGNLSDVNFSSGRMGWLEFARNIQKWQYNIIVPMLCNRIYDWFCKGIEISGFGKAPLYATWTPPKREMIDPAKEAEAMKALVRSGFLSKQEAIRSLGFEPDEVLRELMEDATSVDKANLLFDSDPRHDPKRIVAKDNTNTPPKNANN